jgi:tetratricopeptide (TPR) repeat protein
MADSTKDLSKIIIIVSVILAALFFISGLIPLESFWGFNHLKYLPPYFLYIYALIFVLFLIPYVSESILNLAVNITRSFKKLPKAVQLVIVAIITFVILYLLRVHVHSLGDGYQRIFQVERGYLYYHSEPLDFFLHAVLFRLLKLFGTKSGELSYVIYSIGAGIVFVLSIYFFKLPGQLKKHGGLIKLIIITFGGSLLFFGYVESYSLYYLFAILYILFAVKFMLTKKGLWLASIFFALAIITHLTAAVLLPSILYLLYYSFKKIRPASFTDRYPPLIISIIPFLVLAGKEIQLRMSTTAVPSVSGGILPIFSLSEYSVFSPLHLLDILNHVLLIAPVLIPLLAILIMGKNKTTEKSKIKIFAIITSVSFLLMLFLFDPKLGFARDWDLFTPVTAPLGLIVALSIFSKASFKLEKYNRAILVMFPILFFSGWVILNASEIRQLQRAESLLLLSEKGRGYSTELLAYYYRVEKKDSRKALELLNGITGEAKNARVYSKIAKCYMEMKNYPAAIEALNQVFERDTTFEQTNHYAGVAWLRLNQPEKALPYLLRSQRVEPDRYTIHHFIGNAYFMLDSLEQAAEAFKNGVRTSPDFTPGYFDAANVYRMLGKYDTAYAYIQEGLKKNPKYPDGFKLLDLIKLGLRQGQN